MTAVQLRAAAKRHLIGIPLCVIEPVNRTCKRQRFARLFASRLPKRCASWASYLEGQLQESR
jgi:hypothetical protein